ncbi:MAG TPA: hypothetical protein VN650_10950 [Gemmatimonadaceae bacterium]|nr:hypothetical protein [Gemmatimonadaceae bacterium]
MAMKQLVKFTLDAKQVREACEAFIARRIDTTTEVAAAIVPADTSIMVTVKKRHAPKKPKTVASAAP